MMGLWHYATIDEPTAYGDPATYPLAMAFLDGCETVEDWGCGTAYARQFCTGRYAGIDGSPSRFADKVADLRTYRSQSDGILLRHVLEHNTDWALILANAVASARQRLALVIFTPFAEKETHVIPGGGAIPDISFRKSDLTGLLVPFRVTEQELETGTWYDAETIFYCERP